MIERLKRLCEIAQMVSDTKLSALKEAEDMRRSSERDTDDMRLARRKAIQGAGPDAPHLCGADQRWEVWSAARLRELSTRQAIATAEAETRRLAARRSYGRAQVLKGLLAQEVTRSRKSD